MFFVRLFVLVLLLAAPLRADYLYKTVLLRAAPGKLLNLLELYKNRMSFYDAAGDEKPFMMRHSQGDQWDLLLLFPIKNYRDYYSPGRIEDREMAAQKSRQILSENLKSMLPGTKNCLFLARHSPKSKKPLQRCVFFMLRCLSHYPENTTNFLNRGKWKTVISKDLGVRRT